MNLRSMRRELEHLKALARAHRGSGCVCEYVEVIDGQSITTEQQQKLTRNQECYERNYDRTMHVGFAAILVPASENGLPL